MKTPAPGLTYVLTHPGYRSVKVGFTTEGSDRIEGLGRRGWILHRSLRLQTPDLARAVEQAALFQIRHRLSVPVHLTADLMHAGWTETVSARLLPASAVWQLVCEEAGALYLAPVVRKAIGPGRKRNGGTPPRRVPGDTPKYHRAARVAAAETARRATS